MPLDNSSKCIVWSCKASKDVEGTLMHVLPRNQEKRNLWVNSLGREDLVGLAYEETRGKLVCSKHFNIDQYQFPGSKNLNRNAMPIPIIEGIECNDNSNETDREDEESEYEEENINPSKKKFRSESDYQGHEENSNETAQSIVLQFLEDCEEEIPEGNFIIGSEEEIIKSFGEHVTNSLRSLKSEDKRNKLKRMILKCIVAVSKTDDTESVV